MTQQLTLHSYMDYVGSIEFSKEDLIFFGKVLFIEDTICYESETLDGLQESFENAINEYLDDCKALGIKPNTTCKGSFNVRIPQQLHVDLVRYSIRHNQSLNKTMSIAARELLDSEKVLEIKEKPTPFEKLGKYLERIPSSYALLH